MLEIDDRFKMWMRHRLEDREYAERVLRAVTELDDVVLRGSWLHAALQEGRAVGHDPEAMIGYLEGHVPSTGEDILVGIFGKWKDFKNLVMPYSWLLWNLNPIRTLQDELNLPTLYLVAFGDEERNEPISHVRWRDQDGEEANFFGFDKQKINIINTSQDSKVVRIIAGWEEEDGVNHE